MPDHAQPARIAIVISSMGAGGAERVTATLADAWAARGIDVHIVTIASREHDFYPLDPRVERHALDLARDTRGLPDALRATRQRLVALRRVLRTIGPDVVIGMTTTAAVLSVVASWGQRWSVIVEEHIYPPRLPPGRPWAALRLLTYPRAARVVLLTSDSLAWLRREIPRARGVVIPNPVSHPVPVVEPIVPPGSIVADSRRLLLAVGRLDRQKGFDLLLSAFAKVAARHPDWDLVILGEGSERVSLEGLVSVHGLAERVRLPGVVGNVAHWYERADLFVLSSRFEGFPMTLVEAMAAGCPVVSFDCETGPRDIIVDAQQGRLVEPPEDPAALANALDQLMADQEERGRMIDHASSIIDRYSIERVLALWEPVLEVSKDRG